MCCVLDADACMWQAHSIAMEEGVSLRDAARRVLQAEEAAAAMQRRDLSMAKQVLNLAILGRPNVGKSTLVNQLLQEERVITGPTCACAAVWRMAAHNES